MYSFTCVKTTRNFNKAQLYQYIGWIHYIDSVKQELRLKSGTDGLDYIKLSEIVDVKIIDNKHI
ncbi:YolD-like family protein [Heyndrickxia acidicola]|uniref:YolD-like family protein n=1 Tax=Heyndrickxia acidicola TaxID=209389 RepID=UPI0012ECD971